MDKWHKTFLWILGFLVLGILLITIFGLDLRGITFAFILLSLWEILSTTTQDMKSKWKGFFVRIGILFLFLFIIGIALNISSETGGRLLGIILIIEFILTLSQKKKK